MGSEGKVRVPYILRKKQKKQPITVITAYDYTSARIADESGFDIILVGDSLGMVIQGQESTIPVTLEDLLYHTRCVKRGVKRALVVADMPFLSYQVDERDAIRNAGILIKEGGAEAVKIEGGKEVVSLTKKFTEIGIPVMGHLGLLPQRMHAIGGYKVTARSPEEAKELKEVAILLEEAGAFSIVLEEVPLETGKIVTEALKIPTIGIGAGPFTDGQVLVLHDVLGLEEEFKPKFVKRYLEGEKIIRDALTKFRKEIEERKFPTREHSFSWKDFEK